MIPSGQFQDDDDAAQYWLGVLKTGSRSQRITAREQLASIFERRGMFEEATDLLISNVREGVRNADTFRWLARLYRVQGQEMLAMQSAAEAAKYLPAVSPAHSLPPPTNPLPPPGMAIIPPPADQWTPKPGPQPVARGLTPVAGQRNVPMIWLIAVPMSLVAGVGLSFLVMMTVGVLAPRVNSASVFVVIVMFSGWIPIAVYWGLTSRSPRHAARRALITLAVESFALPVAALVMGLLAGIVGASMAPRGTEGAALLGGLAAGGLMALAFGCVGFLCGSLFLVSWVAVRNDSADR